MREEARSRLAQVLDELHPLPSPRGAALELLRLAADENVPTARVVRVLEADPALAARLIRAANSACWAAAAPVGSIAAAIGRLGFSATRQIALGFSLLSAWREGRCAQFDYGAFWTGSLLRALGARALAARFASGDPHEAFACGLLAEIGRLAFATAQPDAWGELLAAYGGRGDALRSAERERFGADHGALGVALLERWGMPAHLLGALEGYFDPPASADGPDRALRRLAWTLLAAEALAQSAAAPATRRDAWTHLALQAAGQLGAETALLEEVADELAREAERWAPLLELPTPELAAPDFRGYAAGCGLPRGPALRIVLADDDESDRLLFERLLRRAGHEVWPAADGEQALAAIVALEAELLVTDLDMPRMDGFALCRSLRASRFGEEIFVLALTGREGHAALLACIEAGANDLVPKSAPPEVVLARVRAAACAVRMRANAVGERESARHIAARLAFQRCRMEAGARAAAGG